MRPSDEDATPDEASFVVQVLPNYVIVPDRVDVLAGIFRARGSVRRFFEALLHNPGTSQRFLGWSDEVYQQALATLESQLSRQTVEDAKALIRAGEALPPMGARPPEGD